MNPRTAYGRALARSGFQRGRTVTALQVLTQEDLPALLSPEGWHQTYADEDVDSWFEFFRPPPDPARRPHGRERRVLYVTDIYGGHHGGSEGQLVALVSGLPRPWQARLWVLQGSRFLRRNAFPCPAKEMGLARFWPPKVLALAGALRSGRFDVVHTFHSDAPGRWRACRS
jgi:hypothetical protein